MRALAVAGAVVALLPFALLGDERGGNFTLEQARAFAGFPLYWAGEQVDGLPLAAVLRRGGAAPNVSFVYGDCAPASDTGCAPPAEVQIWPAAARGLDSYEGSEESAPSVTPTRVRGEPAAFVGEAQLELYLPAVTVVVFASDREQALAVAHALRCLNAAARPRDGPRGC